MMNNSAFTEFEIELNDMGFWGFLIASNPDMAARFERYFDLAKAENERLRTEVEGLKDQNQEIASSNADHVRWHRETKAEIERLREINQSLIRAHENEMDLAQQAEAKIEAALEAVPLFSECEAGHVAAVTKALGGGD
jgi:predicted  nucleic acid-binding Zn-ribbon protein